MCSGAKNNNDNNDDERIKNPLEGRGSFDHIECKNTGYLQSSLIYICRDCQILVQLKHTSIQRKSAYMTGLAA